MKNYIILLLIFMSGFAYSQKVVLNDPDGPEGYIYDQNDIKIGRMIKDQNGKLHAYYFQKKTNTRNVKTNINVSTDLNYQNQFSNQIQGNYIGNNAVPINTNYADYNNQYRTRNSDLGESLSVAVGIGALLLINNSRGFHYNNWNYQWGYNPANDYYRNIIPRYYGYR